MIDRRRIEDIFRSLDYYLELLRELRGVPEAEFTEDAVKLGAAKYYFQVSIECCIDVANHIIAQKRWRRPESMADVFAVLAENGVVRSEFLPTLQRMARFRNRLVHLYWDVDEKLIYQILQENLGDLERFEKVILDYIMGGANSD